MGSTRPLLLLVIGHCLVVQIRGQSSPWTSHGFSVVDLTHTYDNRTAVWGAEPGFNFTILYRGQNPAGYWFEYNEFSMNEHAGTHVDAPAHFSQTGWRTGDIPPHRLVGPGVIVDVKSKAAADPDYRLSVSDLQDWESQYGEIPDNAIVLMNSGWAWRYPNTTLTFNTNTPADTSTYHFPGFHPQAVDWLLANRNISMIGVDTPSQDYGQSPDFPVHVKAGAANVIGLELVNNLDKVPPHGSIIVVGVIKLSEGSGGPARVMALMSDYESVCSQGNSDNGSGSGYLSSENSVRLMSLVVLCHIVMSFVEG